MFFVFATVIGMSLCPRGRSLSFRALFVPSPAARTLYESELYAKYVFYWGTAVLETTWHVLYTDHNMFCETLGKQVIWTFADIISDVSQRPL